MRPEKYRKRGSGAFTLQTLGQAGKKPHREQGKGWADPASRKLRAHIKEVIVGGVMSKISLGLGGAARWRRGP